jgi:hypothetical protein
MKGRHDPIGTCNVKKKVDKWRRIGKLRKQVFVDGMRVDGGREN